MGRELEISLTQGQADFIASDAKYPLFCAGYGAGKSHTMGLSTVLDVQHSSSALIGVYEPYHDLIRLIAWPIVQMWLTEFGISYTLNKQDSTIYTSNSGVGDIIFRTMDNIDALIGYQTYRSHIDELDTMHPTNAEKAFLKIMGRNRLAPRDVPIEHRKWVELTQQWECKNRISVYTTPEGYKFCYKMWNPEGDNVKKNPEFKLYRGRTQDNPTLTQDYIDELRLTYPAKMLQAYMDGMFVNMESGAVYYNFDRVKHNTSRTIRSDDVIKIGIDFNVGHTCGIAFVDDKHEISIVAEILKQLDTPTLIKAIRNRWPTNKIICFPDNTGKNRSANNADPNANNIALLKDPKHGFEVRTKSCNPYVKNRVASVVKLFEDNRLKVNVQECPRITECFEQQCYDDKGEPDKSTGLDHPLDGAGYRIESTHSIRKPIFKINSSFVSKR